MGACLAGGRSWHRLSAPPRGRSCRSCAAAFQRRCECLFIAMLLAVPAFAQRDRGEIRVNVRDTQGGPVQAVVELASEMNQVRRNFLTDQGGHYVARELPFGVYRLEVSHPGFASSVRPVEVRSEVPLAVSVTLGLAPVQSRIEVTDSATL